MEFSLDPKLLRRLLRVENRRRVHEGICGEPGIHARQLSRDAGLALGVVGHHVRVLEGHGVIFARLLGCRRGLFAADRVAHEDAPILQALREPSWRRALVALVDEERSVRGLAKAFEEAHSSTSHRLHQMAKAGLLENVRIGRESLFSVADPARVRRLIQAHVPERPPPVGIASLIERAGQHLPRPAVLPSRRMN